MSQEWRSASQALVLCLRWAKQTTRAGIMQMCYMVMLIRNLSKKAAWQMRRLRTVQEQCLLGRERKKPSLLETLQPCKAFLSTEQLQSTQKGENLFSAATRLLYHCALEQRQTVYSFIPFSFKTIMYSVQDICNYIWSIFFFIFVMSEVLVY